VAAQVLLHIGRHLADTYGLAGLHPELLQSVNKLAAAKVHAFLQKQADAAVR
jgi:DNA polymerase-3 subunit epsilon